jgi:hypothetical protein
MVKFDKLIDAVWSSKDFDIPVKITGFAFRDDKFYFSIVGSNTYIPYEELKFKEGDDPFVLVED